MDMYILQLHCILIYKLILSDLHHNTVRRRYYDKLMTVIDIVVYEIILF